MLPKSVNAKEKARKHLLKTAETLFREDPLLTNQTVYHKLICFGEPDAEERAALITHADIEYIRNKVIRSFQENDDASPNDPRIKHDG